MPCYTRVGIEIPKGTDQFSTKPGEPITSANRRRWARQPSRGGFMSGERWVLFDDSVVEEIAEQ